MYQHEISIEEIIPRSRGGRRVYGNQVLAHKRCNSIAGNLLFCQKIKLRKKQADRLSPVSCGVHHQPVFSGGQAWHTDEAQKA